MVRHIALWLEKPALNMLFANCFFAKLAEFIGNLIDRERDRKEKFSVRNWPVGEEERRESMMRVCWRPGPNIITGLELKRLLCLIFISFAVLNINVDIKERGRRRIERAKVAREEGVNATNECKLNCEIFSRIESRFHHLSYRGCTIRIDRQKLCNISIVS